MKLPQDQATPQRPTWLFRGEPNSHQRSKSIRSLHQRSKSIRSLIPDKYDTTVQPIDPEDDCEKTTRNAVIHRS